MSENNNAETNNAEAAPVAEFEPFSPAQQIKLDSIIKAAQGRAGREARAEAAAERRKREDLERVLNEQYKNPDNSKLELEMELSRVKQAEADLRTEVEASRKNSAIQKSFKNADVKLVDAELSARLLAEGVSYNPETKTYQAIDSNGAPISLDEAAKQFAASHPYLVYSGLKPGQNSAESKQSSLTSDSAEQIIRSVLGPGYQHVKLEMIFGSGSGGILANKIALKDVSKYKALQSMARERKLI